MWSTHVCSMRAQEGTPISQGHSKKSHQGKGICQLCSLNKGGPFVSIIWIMRSPAET